MRFGNLAIALRLIVVQLMIVNAALCSDLDGPLAQIGRAPGHDSTVDLSGNGCGAALDATPMGRSDRRPVAQRGRDSGLASEWRAVRHDREENAVISRQGAAMRSRGC